MADISFNRKQGCWFRSYDANWDTAHDAAYAFPYSCAQGLIPVGAYYETSGIYTGYNIYRSTLYFDTSIIPSTYTITAATLNLHTVSFIMLEATTHVVEGTFNLPIDESGYSGCGSTSFGSITFEQTTTTSALKTITLNSSGIAGIVKEGITKFALINSYDFNDTAPNTTIDELYKNGHYFANPVEGFEDYPIYLEITATAPSGYYCVQFFASSNGSLSGTTFQTVASSGDTSAVWGVPDPTYQFKNWKYGSSATTDNPLVIENVTSDIEATVKFMPVPPSSYDWGFTCSSQNQKVQIDGFNNNYYLESIGNAAFSGDGVYGQEVALESGASDSASLLAVKLLSDQYFCVPGFESGPDGQTGKFLGEYDESTYSVDYSIWRCATLENPVPPDPSNWGLHVWDATGTYLVFSSGARYMRIAGIYEVDCPIYTNNGVPGSTVNVTVEDAVNNYFIMSPLNSVEDVFIITGTSIRVIRYVNMFKRHDSTTVTIGNMCPSYTDYSWEWPYYNQYPNSERRVYATPKIRLIEISDRPASS